MYLEIAPRQVGKSTRLASAVVKHLETTDDTVYVLASNFDQCKRLKKMVDETARYFGAANTRSYEMTAVWYMRGNSIKHQNTKLFVDEFDFILPSIQESLMRPEFTDILRNGYFASTPLYIRRKKDLYKEGTVDLMARLLQMNNHKYNVHLTHFPHMHGRNLDSGHGRNELFGAFSE